MIKAKNITNQYHRIGIGENVFIPCEITETKQNYQRIHQYSLVPT